MTKNIAVVGCGSIGMRHVEALGRLSIEANVYAVDLNEEQAIKACELFSQAKLSNGGKSNISALNDFMDLPETIDLLILATAAQIRFELFEALVQTKSIKYVIFEKFLFNRPEYYGRALKMLQKEDIRAWVNCPRRCYPAYQDIKSKLDEAEFVHMKVSIPGRLYHLGISAIHFADLLEFLMPGDHRNAAMNTQIRNPQLVHTKRGISDMNGKLEFSISDNGSLMFETLDTSDLPLLLSIETNQRRILVFESAGYYLDMSADNRWHGEKRDFSVVYQSNMSHELAETILSSGECELPSYEVSANIHLSLLEAFLDGYRVLQENQTLDGVPFT